jgi:hypothetical protein
VQQAISARTNEEVAGGVMALKEWATRASSGAATPLPDQLVNRLISTIESRREVGMTVKLSGAHHLIVAGILSKDDRSRIELALGELFIEKQYERIDPDSREAVAVSLMRAECVRLANALKESGGSSPHIASWLTAASADPLPEVRFSLSGGQDH